MEKNKSATNPITCGRVNPDIFDSDDVAKWCPVSYRAINQYGGTTCKFGANIARSMAHALKAFYCRGAVCTRVNPDTIGCVWTGEFDLNTLRVDGEIFESGKKKLRIQKFPDTCGRGLTRTWSFHVVVLQRTAKKYTKIYNARAQLLFCSLNLLFGGVLVAVDVVACLTSLLQYLTYNRPKAFG